MLWLGDGSSRFLEIPVDVMALGVLQLAVVSALAVVRLFQRENVGGEVAEKRRLQRRKLRCGCSGTGE